MSESTKTNSISRRQRKLETRFCKVLFVVGCILVFMSDFFQSPPLLLLIGLVMSAAILFTVCFAIMFTDLQTVLVGVAAVSFCLSIWTTHWPLHAGFLLSKRHVSDLAIQVENGELVGTRNCRSLPRQKIVQKPNGAICFCQRTINFARFDPGRLYE